ncbi:hypothetical protein TrLO_g6149 [Triparma laevis f. longispina]|uniref:Myb-like domain-containing protein n=1 Tax=Triparma laevis f. longispina TaxID=1714387 RepID=A0A9W6ZAU4_9STRA|nr:hypothetical protein TrLO_g6149 [Triparma laevis f. longispina]
MKSSQSPSEPSVANKTVFVSPPPPSSKVPPRTCGFPGREGEGVEDEVVVALLVLAASSPAETFSLRSGKKRKSASQVEEQLRNVKKAKSAFGGRGFVWSADENAALVEGVNSHGLDFDRIKAEAGARLLGRKVRALSQHFRQVHPDKFRELREVTPTKQTNLWTDEEDEALKRGRWKYGSDWEKIMKTESEVLGDRTVGALKNKVLRL